MPFHDGYTWITELEQPDPSQKLRPVPMLKMSLSEGIEALCIEHLTYS
jgi:hypothetical protein